MTGDLESHLDPHGGYSKRRASRCTEIQLVHAHRAGQFAQSVGARRSLPLCFIQHSPTLANQNARGRGAVAKGNGADLPGAAVRVNQLPGIRSSS